VRSSKAGVSSPFFRVGEPIPQSGIYRVFHAEHRNSHDVVLVRGEAFPRCSACGDNVHFELLEAAPQIDADENFRDFRSRKLFELPHPDEVKSA
jgi:hypothetical protein